MFSLESMPQVWPHPAESCVNVPEGMAWLVVPYRSDPQHSMEPLLEIAQFLESAHKFENKLWACKVLAFPLLSINAYPSHSTDK